MIKDFNSFLKQVAKDVKVELDEEFDRNFERKAFFNTPWVQSKLPNNRGSLLLRTGALRRSIKSSLNDHRIDYTSSHPAAALHNEGGTLVVTAKMKKFFWAMYYKVSGAITQKKDGTARKTKRNETLTQEAAYYKGMALMKIGEKIKIPQRQFIGWHPQLENIVKQIVDDNVQELAKEIEDTLQQFGH